MRIFNTTGPVRCAEHYCLPPLERMDLDEIMFLIEQKKILYAPCSPSSGQNNLSFGLIWYARDLGLIKTEGHLRIANKIYQEIIPRALTFTTQVLITHETTWYVNEAGQLDIHKLLHTFQQFFRENAEHWVKRFDYQEAGPQLLMQAFLQRVINSGGRIEREYGLGRGRTDLLLIWPHAGGVQRVVIELKIRYGELEKTLSAGLAQTWTYMDTCGADEGHLVIFDRDENKSWQEKIFVREACYEGHLIKVWGM